MLTTFFKDPFSILKFHLKLLVFLGLSLAALGGVKGLGWPIITAALLIAIPHVVANLLGCAAYVLGLALTTGITFAPSHAALIFGGLTLGALSASLMHNASHGNIRPLWLCKLTGTFMGMQQVLGYPEWLVLHLVHHKYPDDPEKDSQPSERLPLWKYVLVMKFFMAMALERIYYGVWGGKTARNRKRWAITVLFILTGQIVVVLFWHALLGPTGFLYFFLPSYVAVHALYVHFNYFTHRPNTGGGIEILDRNDTRFYRFMNAISFGSYFHKTHHKNPRAFNPLKYSLRRAAVAASSVGT